MEEKEEDFAATVDATIARNVKLARERAEMSQAELAAKLTEAGVAGIHQTTIARIESGQRVLRLAEALALARFFDYQLEDWVESGTSARLRSNSVYLRKGVTEFYSAAEELHFRRWRTAEYLDREFPYTPDGHEIAVVKADPRAFSSLDELLTTNSDPAMIVDGTYTRWLHEARESPAITPFVRGYAMELYEEAVLKGYERVNDYSEQTDEAFNIAVISRFEESPYGEHPEAP